MNIQIGDLVWFHSLFSGPVKGKVIDKYVDEYLGHIEMYRIRITGHSTRIYPAGYVLDTTHNWISPR